MRSRNASATDPDTYSAGEVASIFKDEITARHLIDWDDKAWFRPSFYMDPRASGTLLSPIERDQRDRTELTRGTAPERRYTFMDLLWLGIFLYAKKTFERTKVRNAAKRASEVIKALRETNDSRIPARSRLLFFREDTYLLEDSGEVRPLPPAKQLPLTGLFAADVASELRGRIEVLAARNELHAVLTVDTPSETPTGS
jgi:hypothetical protein